MGKHGRKLQSRDVKDYGKQMYGCKKLYLEGCGFQRIARIMSKIVRKIYRYQTMMNRDKRAGLNVLSENTKP